MLLAQALAPADRADPYPVYRQLREYGPLHLPEVNLMVLSSYAHCDAVLRHPHAASDRNKSTIAQRQLAQGKQPRPFGLAGLVDQRRTPAFLFLDPPDHTRLRKLVVKAFAPRVISAMQAEITAVVDDLLDTAQQNGEFDAVTGLAYPLAVAVICRLLGVPVEDEPQFGRASTLLGQTVDPFLAATGVPEGFHERIEAGKWLRSYFRELIARRRRAPGDDLISALVAVEESGDQLTEDEIISTCNLLLIAGHEALAGRLTAGEFVSLMTAMMAIIPALKNLKLTLETMELLNYPRDRWRIVMNRADSKVGLSMPRRREDPAHHDLGADPQLARRPRGHQPRRPHRARLRHQE
jgi:cytochrome P450